QDSYIGTLPHPAPQPDPFPIFHGGFPEAGATFQDRRDVDRLPALCGRQAGCAGLLLQLLCLRPATVASFEIDEVQRSPGRFPHSFDRAREVTARPTPDRCSACLPISLCV